jgi:succinate dehydrogenase / fumarate reductase flavoprotein subunit
VSRVLDSTGDEKVAAIRAELQSSMDDNASVMRDAAKLTTMQTKLAELRDRYYHIRIQDQGKLYNSDLAEAVELENLLDIADTIVAGALAREESRGAHYREDFPKRDDSRFLAHTLAWRTEDGVAISHKPVTITWFQPQERKY